MYETTEDFDFWGDYAMDYAAESVAAGFSEVVEIYETDHQGFAFFGGGGGAKAKQRFARVKVTKAGFKKPGPCGDTEAKVGAVGHCPAEWL